MRRILKEARLHAPSDVKVLITGESGTGKELLTRAIHQVSDRYEFPFTSINMASPARGRFDSEFFGHTWGAVTGAERNRVGYLEHRMAGPYSSTRWRTFPSTSRESLFACLNRANLSGWGE